LCASFKEVEHSCQQCGTAVEDGRPFCPQCRAPQIHVQIAVPDTAVAEGLNPEVPIETDLASPQTRPATFGSTMDRSVAVRAALKAGVLGALLAVFIPLLGVVLAGTLAVFFYRRENRFVLPVALGLRLGGAAGVVAFAIYSIFVTSLIFVTHSQQKYIDDVTTMVRRFGANPADPDLQASLHTLFTPAGLVLAFFFGMIFAMVLASVGGALASLFLRPRNPHL
jgi:hypothetical protein